MHINIYTGYGVFYYLTGNTLQYANNFPLKIIQIEIKPLLCVRSCLAGLRLRSLKNPLRFQAIGCVPKRKSFGVDCCCSPDALPVAQPTVYV